MSNNAKIFTHDGAWCWFQDPRAVFVQGRYCCTYAQWVTHDGNLIIGAYNHDTGEVATNTLRTRWDADDHNVGAILVLPDKRLMVFYTQHNKQSIFCRTALHPESIDAWGDEITVCDDVGVTYVHPVRLSAENKIYLFWRGKTWKPTFATSTDGRNWSNPQILIQDIGRESGKIRPYIKVANDGVASIALAFTDGHPAVEPTNSLYFLKITDGHILRADGSCIGDLKKLPVAHSQCEMIYNGATHGRAWVWDAAFDHAGNPVVVYTRIADTHDHRYHYARWNGREWHDVELAAAGPWFPQTPSGAKEREPFYSGGMALDQGNPSRVAVARNINNQFEIELLQRTDCGITWETTTITRASKELNVRPVFPRYDTLNEARYLLWMSGKYVHYTDYKTAIKIMVL